MKRSVTLLVIVCCLLLWILLFARAPSLAQQDTTVPWGFSQTTPQPTQTPNLVHTSSPAWPPVPSQRDNRSTWALGTPIPPGSGSPGSVRILYLPLLMHGETFFVSFSASARQVEPGQAVTLSWTVRDARAVYLDEERVRRSGSRVVTPWETTTYVLRIVKMDFSGHEERLTISVRGATETPTPTITPTATPTPVHNIRFAVDLTTATIDGTGCQTGNGCAVFQIQVKNLGNRTGTYWFEKTQELAPGWGSFFCWGSDCEFGDETLRHTVGIGSIETVHLNFKLPAGITQTTVGQVRVKGFCENCANPAFDQVLTIRVIVPTPTPTVTATPQREISVDGDREEAFASGTDPERLFSSLMSQSVCMGENGIRSACQVKRVDRASLTSFLKANGIPGF